MPEKLLRMRRAGGDGRPRMLAIAGDSAAGKTTLTAGIVEALGEERCTSVCVDDYHRYDRSERASLPFTPLHPDCNYMEVMEQHLGLLATAQPVLKPVYDHSTGELVRPELTTPRDYVIAEGLLPLHTRLAQACFDASVYLDPPEDIRVDWKTSRDMKKRGYTREEVAASLKKREDESEAYIRPQRANADIVVRFAPIEGRDDPPGTPLSATILLRPTIRHPDLSPILDDDHGLPIHLKLEREDGRPVEALHVHGYAPREDTMMVQKRIWEGLDLPGPVPACLGSLGEGERSEPLAVTQLILLHHLLARD